MGLSRARKGLGVTFAPLPLFPRAWRGSGGHSQMGMSLQQSMRVVFQSLSWHW